MKKDTKHHQLVDEFFRQARWEDDDKYKEVCEESPVLSYRAWKEAQRREIHLSTLSPEKIAELGLEEGDQ